VSRTQRVGLFIAGVGLAALALGFTQQWDWALETFPWELSRLSAIFVGAIFAAVAAATFSIAMTGDWANLPPGALNVAIMLGGSAAVFSRLAARGDDDMIPFAAAASAGAFVSLLGFVGLARRPIPNPTPLPSIVRAAYLAFTFILLASGMVLLTGATDVLPWVVDGRSAAIFGWIFFSDAFYFLYAVVRPYWQCGRAQLWSFLAYDLVLIGPLLDHFSVVTDDLRLNLVLYVAVLVVSGALCISYLSPRRFVAWPPKGV
jgi:hypothetical protein